MNLPNISRRSEKEIRSIVVLLCTRYLVTWWHGRNEAEQGTFGRTPPNSTPPRSGPQLHHCLARQLFCSVKDGLRPHAIEAQRPKEEADNPVAFLDVVVARRAKVQGDWESFDELEEILLPVDSY
jgi:hypothetical protein